MDSVGYQTYWLAADYINSRVELVMCTFASSRTGQVSLKTRGGFIRRWGSKTYTKNNRFALHIPDFDPHISLRVVSPEAPSNPKKPPQARSSNHYYSLATTESHSVGEMALSFRNAVSNFVQGILGNPQSRNTRTQNSTQTNHYRSGKRSELVS